VSHDVVSAGWHMPLPLQVRGAEYVAAVQDAISHWVPAG
jgi:hypothetical protein